MSLAPHFGDVAVSSGLTASFVAATIVAACFVGPAVAVFIGFFGSRLVPHYEPQGI